MSQTPTDLVIEDLAPGEGKTVTGRGQTVTVHYTGWLTDGSEFDSSRKHGEPFSFPVDIGYVIKGWGRGVVGMRAGGKRRLTVPPHLGYGAAGAGGVIPPNAVLIFEIELLKISD